MFFSPKGGARSPRSLSAPLHTIPVVCRPSDTKAGKRTLCQVHTGESGKLTKKCGAFPKFAIKNKADAFVYMRMHLNKVITRADIALAVLT